MKFKASILFFWVLVYIMELAALPVYCMPVEKKETASTRKAASPCSGKTETACTRKTETPCAPKRAAVPCQKPTSDCNNSTANCCVNCPLCYVMTLPGVAFGGKTPDNVKKEYSLYQSHYIFLYCSTTWKPPNGC